LLLSKGYSSRKISEFYPVSFKQINNWASRFDAEGLDGLRVKSGKGRRSFLSADQKEDLCKDFLNSPEEFGFNTSTWTGALFGEHIGKKYGIFYKKSALYKLIHQLGFSFQRAKSFYPERKEADRQDKKVDIKKL
jgi:transposase